jgi:2,4-dienoyl-CoA reductase-like NADH-dependent reductase (Old Yellow Enzyme family)
MAEMIRIDCAILQKFLDSGTKNLLASLCLSSRKQQNKNEEEPDVPFECSTRERSVSAPRILRLGSVKSVSQFAEHVRALQLQIPCDPEILGAAQSPLFAPLVRGGVRIGNRIAINPMEGWDGTADGAPTENTLRRWRRFGASGAKLIWGGEAVAVCHSGRANPHQLVIAERTRAGLAQLRTALVAEHKLAAGSEKDLLIGLQLTHSGRYSKPNSHRKPEPKILYRHPILDRRLGLAPDFPLLADSEIESIVEEFCCAGRIASELGFDFVDVKHCHGYLGHEFLGAHTREGKYGGSFENRTRFLREVVQGIRAAAPGLKIGVRVSAFDTVPFYPDPSKSVSGAGGTQLGPGIPEPHADLLPYRWGFGVDASDPTQPDLAEPIQFLALLESLNISLVNLTAGSPYYNPHIQRPALYPPSDGYAPPEDPLVGVARQMNATRELKRQFPNLIFVGTAYSYLQDFLPHVAQAALREGGVDCVGLGRMVLTYPEIFLDAAQGRGVQHKRICRTFSDCTTAPRNGLPSGCYPLDSHYKNSSAAVQLATAKAKR